jgi:hypothetical protein
MALQARWASGSGWIFYAPVPPKGAHADNAQRWILGRRTQVTKTMPLTDLEAIVLQQGHPSTTILARTS